ncbi:unnamed protein product [Adineta ricciae]|uniref:Uncharacterized protein n=1 Tax=Adineta ricciae TaxID=249248 RepID=A0A815NZ50_ADIRI|nr:unnamed protein product [Adineta ricciae]
MTLAVSVWIPQRSSFDNDSLRFPLCILNKVVKHYMFYPTAIAHHSSEKYDITALSNFIHNSKVLLMKFK